MPGSRNSAVAQVGFRGSSQPDKAAAAPALPVPWPCQSQQHKPACMTSLPLELCFPLGPWTQARTKTWLWDSPHKWSHPTLLGAVVHQTPKFWSSHFYKNRNHCCGEPHSPVLFPMKEAGNNDPDSHFHPEAIAALATTPQPFPSHTTRIPINKF